VGLTQLLDRAQSRHPEAGSPSLPSMALPRCLRSRPCASALSS